MGMINQPAASAANEESDATITMELEEGYRFRVDFGLPGVSTLVMDEPAPLGEQNGPNASRVLAAAVGNCLSASALFCLNRARVPVHRMRTTVSVSLTRSESGRLRIGRLRVQIEPQVDDPDSGRVRRCLELFEDYCVVTQSVRHGVDVDVQVQPRSKEPAG
ncbi:OsmC family protein [Mycobacterium sp. SM1]|uniref:OsmC family protein n=1 Tax=Mycobacterium sp. SM1 TaxID=2816243 RepID=UPI001BD15E02|nr:OsmC family protein [Mycobacterium sp. SM1]MBS4729280.1 OsmC family protein [Mycobacterium sp. SM1]